MALTSPVCWTIGSPPAGLVARATELKEDASLATFYLVSLALGVTIVSIKGTNIDLLHVLFGDILAMDNRTLLVITFNATITLLVLAVIYRPLVIECVDPVFLRTVSRAGAPAHLAFLALVVINLVNGFHALGTLLGVGLMILPAGIARFWSRDITGMICIAVASAILSGYAGLVLSFQTDLTRVFSFLMVREASVRSYPELGVPDSHHPLSHHQNNPEKMAKQAKLTAFQMKMLAYFVEKLSTTRDGDGPMLDNALLLYGSGMSDSNLHLPKNLPTAVVFGKAIDVKGNRHVKFADGTPFANLQLTLLRKLGLSVDSFGDSTGTLSEISA